MSQDQPAAGSQGRPPATGRDLTPVIIILVVVGVVVVAVVLIVVALLIAAISQVRESARRAMCTSNMKQIGLAFANFENTRRTFPASSGVTRDPSGKITAVDGWSWQVHLLPYLEERPLYDTLEVGRDRPQQHPEALRTPIVGYTCPSFRGSPWVDPNTMAEAITNYKAMGATHIESLSVASPEPQRPKYGAAGAARSLHPDGACFPGNGLRAGDFSDGLSHTIFVAETVEPRFARWTIGAEAAFVGLPPIVEYAPFANMFSAPKGFNGKFGAAGGTERSYRTYLSWDYDKNPYDGAGGSQYGKYGPSSHHSGVVNHLFGDGATRSIQKDVDVAAYMFLITRNGSDPGAPELRD